MSTITTQTSYLGKAWRRLVDKGPVNTASYSFHVVKKLSLDVYIDLRFGRSLCVDRAVNHSNPDRCRTEHSNYYVLRELFRYISVKPNDVLVDIGCGDGRVISFWLNLGLKNQIIGVEIDEQTAKSTQRRFSRYQNVKIIHGNGASHPPESGTLFYLFNPFGGSEMLAFERALRGRNVRIMIYAFHDLKPFEHAQWRIEKLYSTRDECQYRLASIEAR